MKVLIQTPKVEAGKSLLDFVREKVGKLSDFSERLLEARVILKFSKSDIRENKICEIRGVISGNDLFVVKQASTFKEASMKAVDAMKRQITDLKS